VDYQYIGRLKLFVSGLDDKVFEKLPVHIQKPAKVSEKEEILIVLETRAKNYENLTKGEKKELFELKQRAHELFKELNNKFRNDFPEIIFDRIISLTQLRAEEINEIRSFVKSKQAKYYEKCMVTSALTLSLLQELEVNRLELLIDFVHEGETQVWQRALVGIVFALQNKTNKLYEYPKTQQKITSLKEVPRIQKALLIVHKAYHKFQTDIAQENTIVDLLLIFSKMKENDFFEEPQHWLLPFYPENETARKYVQSQQKHNINTGEFMKLLDANIAIGNADKYAICLYLDKLTPEQVFGGENGQLKSGLIKVLKGQKRKLEQVMQETPISQDFVETALYEQYLMDLYQFLKHFPNEKYQTNLLKSQQLYQKSILELVAEETSQLLIEAQYHLDAQNYPQARELYRALTRLTPQSEEIWYNLGVVNYKLGDYSQAIKTYKEVIALDAKDHRTWNNLGVAYFMNNDQANAIQAYQTAISIKSDKDEAWYNLGYLQLYYRKFYEAKQAFQKVLIINKNRGDAWDNLGISHMMLKEYKEAIEAFLSALQLKKYKDTEDTWYNLGMCYVNIKQYEKALEAYQQTQKLNPDLVEVWVNIGYVYLVLKNTTEAQKHLETAQMMSKVPNDAILVNLGHIALIEQASDQTLDQALGLYKKALQVSNPQVFFTGIQDDFQYLEPQGVTKETFDKIITQLREYQQKNLLDSGMNL